MFNFEIKPKPKPKTIFLSNSTTVIYQEFSNREDIEAINIPDSVTSIKQGAFSYCSQLKNITLPNFITSIEKETFFDCNLEHITLPTSVTNIKKRAFGNCKNLKTVNLHNSLISIGEETFINCFSIESINLPNSLKSVGKDAFRCCFNLKNVNILTGIENAEAIYLLILSLNKHSRSRSQIVNYKQRFLQIAMACNFFRYICKYICYPKINNIISDTLDQIYNRSSMHSKVKVLYKPSPWV